MYKSSSFIVCTAGLLGFTLLVAGPVAAAWPTDPLVNVPLCTAAGDQQYPMSVSDAAGGAIVAWCDTRSGNVDIYAQRVSVDGTPQWRADGVALCSAAGNQEELTIASDGAGGAIVAWVDYRNSSASDIYAQRIAASGVVLWTPDGVAVCTAAGWQGGPAILADGGGGAFVAWHDSRDGIYDIYAQRILADGTAQWTSGGAAICNAVSFQHYPGIASDGAGGAILAWHDNRGGSTDVYAQRVSPDGTPQWTANGVSLCSTGQGPVYYGQCPAVVSDGAGGADVTWFDMRSGMSDPNIYAQRISAGGTPQWTANGVALCTANGNQVGPTSVSDGAGGVIACWKDYRSGSSYDIYAQRVSAGGATQWMGDGIVVCSAISDQQSPMIVCGGSGGSIVTWYDSRGGSCDIYTQLISGDGATQWSDNGVAVCAAAGNQEHPAVVSDDAGGAVVAWQDHRNGTSYDTYGQRVTAAGRLGGCEAPRIQSIEDVPMDQGGKVLVLWSASCRDVPEALNISDYTLWRRVTATVARRALAQGAALVPGNYPETGIPREGAIRMSAEGTKTVYWEYIVSVPARGAAGYGYTSPTTADSMPGLIPYNVFFVDAKEASSSLFYVSDPDSGYSVDNLAPGVPGNLRFASPAVLAWTEAPEQDFDYFTVYGSSQAELDSTAVLVGHTTQITEDVSDHPFHYYHVTAIDFSGNEGSAASIENPAPSDGEGAAVLPGRFALRSIVPNPTASGAAVAFDLPKDSHVALRVFDAGGRVVATLVNTQMQAGAHRIVWAGTNSQGGRVATGLYFCRMDAGEFTETRKVIIAR